jgi:ribonucleotide monophosphatase NagD (HAD superfamily)
VKTEVEIEVRQLQAKKCQVLLVTNRSWKKQEMTLLFESPKKA